MRLQNVLYDCEPQSGTSLCAASAPVDPVEALRNSWQGVRGNAQSVIGNDDPNHVSCETSRHLNATMGTIVLNSVIYQIRQGLPE